MLEYIVSVLPSDWFSLVGWPGFSKCTVTSKICGVFLHPKVFLLLTIAKIL